MPTDTQILLLPTDDPGLTTVLTSLQSEVPGRVPDMVKWDGENFTIILADPSDSNERAYDARVIPGGTTATLAIGLADQPPESGNITFSYSDDPDDPITLTYANLSAATLQVALNALRAHTDSFTCTVTQSGVEFVIIDDAPGVRPDLLVDATALFPLSQASVEVVQAGSNTQRNAIILTVVQSPYAQTTDYTPLPPAAYTLTTVQAGSLGAPAVQTISLDPPPYGGTFTVDSRAIPWNATAAAFATAYGVPPSKVSKTGDYAWTFTQVNNGVKVSTVSVANLRVLSGFQMALDLSTLEMTLAFARVTGDGLNALITFRAVFPGGRPLTFLLAPVRVLRSVLSGVALPARVNPGYWQPYRPDITALAGPGSTLANITGTLDRQLILFVDQNLILYAYVFAKGDVTASDTTARVHAADNSGTWYKVFSSDYQGNANSPGSLSIVGQFFESNSS